MDDAVGEGSIGEVPAVRDVIDDELEADIPRKMWKPHMTENDRSPEERSELVVRDFICNPLAEGELDSGVALTNLLGECAKDCCPNEGSEPQLLFRSRKLKFEPDHCGSVLWFTVMVSCREGPENLVGRLGVEEVPADSGREVDRLANEVEETDDVGLSGTVWSNDGVRTTFEVKIERIESQKILGSCDALVGA